jgi:hypothetical protein
LYYFSVEERTLTCLGSAQTGNDEAEVEVSFGGYKRLLKLELTTNQSTIVYLIQLAAFSNHHNSHKRPPTT